MGKIGRNDPCPCGSGLKFKKCCLVARQEKRPLPPPPTSPPSLTAEIKALQQVAAERRPLFKVLGVFIFFATEAGDAWVLEASEMDALQVAAAGEALAVELEESPQTLEINWSHRFSIKQKRLWLTSHADRRESSPECPVPQIQAAIKKIRKRISPELLQSIHLQEGQPQPE